MTSNHASAVPALRSAFGQQLYDGLNALPGSGRLSPEQLEIIYAMAYAHVAQGQYEQGLPLFAFLSQYGPTRKHYLAGLALCLNQVGRYEEAVRIYSLIGVLYPGSPDTALRVAECQIAMGDLEAARVSLALAIDATEGDPAWADTATRARSLRSLLGTTTGAA